MTPAQDTIAAIATAPGAGGVGIVRLSGPRAQAIAKTVCARALSPRRATMMRPKSSGRVNRPSSCTVSSCASVRTGPSGWSWFSLRTAAITCSGVTASASSAGGFR